MEHGLLHCETCGGVLIYESVKHARCPFCGNEYFFKEEKSEAMILALNRANELRLRNDFDGAITEYKILIERNPRDAEAYWGLAISTYGIEYVEDPRTKQRIPTCRRTVGRSIFDDENYQKALDNATEAQREQYKARAKVIDRLQRDIKRRLDEEEDYDVFISFKSTDDAGNPTKDRVIARRIYDELERRGIKTFFSEITLKNRLGEEFEPIIFKALYSCKFFILVATNSENVQSAWVKNEWSRFRDRVADEGLTGACCAVFEGFSPSELPSFLRAQGVSLAKYPAGGYEIEIADSLSAKLGKTDRQKEAENIRRQIEEQRLAFERSQSELARKLTQTQSPVGVTVSIDNLLTRAEQERCAGNFDRAIEYYERILDTDPHNDEAWYGKLLAMRKQTVDDYADLDERGFVCSNQLRTYDEYAKEKNSLNQRYNKFFGIEFEKILPLFGQELQDNMKALRDRIKEKYEAGCLLLDAAEQKLKNEEEEATHGWRACVVAFIKGQNGAPDKFVLKNCFNKNISAIRVPVYAKESTYSKVSEIDSRAFSGCAKLREIELPQKLEKIGSCAFDGCASLSEINFPPELQQIGWSAFSNCSSLKYVGFSQNLRAIGGHAFENCTALREIELPQRLDTIAWSAFRNCSSLATVRFPQGLQQIWGRAFANCSSLTNIELPQKLTSIDVGVFSGCSSLKQIELPESLIAIDDYAFADCTSLKRIELPPGLKKIGKHAFDGCVELSELHIPEEIKKIGQAAFNGCQRLTDFEIPQGIRKVWRKAFRDNQYLTTVRLPDSIVKISKKAFFGCASLRTVIAESEAVARLAKKALKKNQKKQKIEIVVQN